MSLSFRNEVFALCKKAQKNMAAKEISNTIMALKITKGNISSGEIPRNPHGDFAQLAEHSNNQFHGYLFVDDNADKIQLPAFLSIKRLSNEERMAIEKGHKTLTRFVELCLNDMREKSPIIADAISPYYLYKGVSLNNDTISLFEDSEYDDLVKSFKSGKVYKALFGSDIDRFSQIINKNNLQALMAVIEKEFSTGYNEDIPSDLSALSMRLLNKQLNAPDILYAYAIMIYALKESLRMACQLLFGAICGGDLVVLNNDNLINIENRTSSQICIFYKVFVQGALFSVVGNLVGDVLLMDCDDSTNNHIHEFGMVTSTTIQFGGEFGETSKISFVIVDNELIPISNITNTILNHGLPNIVIK